MSRCIPVASVSHDTTLVRTVYVEGGVELLYEPALLERVKDYLHGHDSRVKPCKTLHLVIQDFEE